MSFALVAAVLEITCEAVRAWSVDHPATVGLVTGAALFVGTVYGFERILARRDSRRWMTPGREALNTWVFVVDAELETILDEVENARSLLASADADSTDPAALFVELGRDHPYALRKIADQAWKSMRTIGLATNSVAATTSRTTALAGHTQLMFDVQRKLDDLAGGPRIQASMLHPIMTGEHAAVASEQSLRIGREFLATIRSIRSDIGHMRLWIMETRKPY